MHRDVKLQLLAVRHVVEVTHWASAQKAFSTKSGLVHILHPTLRGRLVLLHKDKQAHYSFRFRMKYNTHEATF